MREGAALIRYFCCPCKPTKTNGGRTRNLPEHDPEKWKIFRQYNIRDVETERHIDNLLEPFTVPDFIWQQWRDDVRMNSRGIAHGRKSYQRRTLVRRSVQRRTARGSAAADRTEQPQQPRSAAGMAGSQRNGSPQPAQRNGSRGAQRATKPRSAASTGASARVREILPQEI